MVLLFGNGYSCGGVSPFSTWENRGLNDSIWQLNLVLLMQADQMEHSLTACPFRMPHPRTNRAVRLPRQDSSLEAGMGTRVSIAKPTKGRPFLDQMACVLKALGPDGIRACGDVTSLLLICVMFVACSFVVLLTIFIFLTLDEGNCNTVSNLSEVGVRIISKVAWRKLIFPIS